MKWLCFELRMETKQTMQAEHELRINTSYFLPMTGPIILHRTSNLILTCKLVAIYYIGRPWKQFGGRISTWVTASVYKHNPNKTSQ